MDKIIKQYIADTIKKDLVEIKYQPQFEYCGEGDFRIVGTEALLRPDTDICHVDKFLATAVKSKQIVDLGYWLLRKSLLQLREWRDQNIVTSTFSMSVNVAAEQLQDNDFCKTVMEILYDCEIEPEQLTLELTETSMINDINIIKISRLTGLGVRVSIDDFGTGYSSLARLKLLPVNEIKVDKMFVDDITKTEQDIALITAIYQLTHALNKFTVVEGVESNCQYLLLREIGFTCFQGFYFSEAVPAKELSEIVNLVNSLHCQSYQM